MSEYLTVSKKATGEYTEQRSRFISTVIPVSSETDAIKFINDTKQKYWDARHNVYAYILRDGGICRYSDDGEPHSTAGLPTLDVLRKKNLTDVCVVTTRYFGGILLGTGGLVRAYTAAANEAIISAGIAVMRKCDVCSVKCEYTDYSYLEQVLTANKAVIENTEFTDKVEVFFYIDSAKKDLLGQTLTDNFFGKLSIKVRMQKFMPFCR